MINNVSARNTPELHIYIRPNDNILIPSTHLCFSSTNSVFGSTQGTGVEHAVLARLIDSLCRSNCRMTLDSFSCKVSRSSSNYNKSNIIHSLYPDKLKIKLYTKINICYKYIGSYFGYFKCQLLNPQLQCGNWSVGCILSWAKCSRRHVIITHFTLICNT